jgi:histidinol dehydrogenase
MQVSKYPPRFNWSSFLTRPSIDLTELEERVSDIIAEVRANGDEAVRRFSKRFDGYDGNLLMVSDSEIAESESLIDIELKKAIALAKANIESFHSRQRPGIEVVNTMPGIECWRKAVPIQKVGLYIPGGTAPLFSTILMLGIPAVIAGCSEIVLCTPPAKDGSIHPAILYTAKLVGITQIVKAGGVQAIAAMAYGTETIPAVYKIFGPGNQYVTCAKQLVQKAGVAIDMPAGPSEVAIFADESADASFIAADLLSQAEHGADSQVLLVTTDELLIENVEREIAAQLDVLPRKAFAALALQNSRIILVEDSNEAMDLLNEYAPEHLILLSANASNLADKVVNAGSVFVGHYSPESVGDYASGTNHTLPTNGYARSYSGVSVDSFMKKITFQQLSAEGLRNVGPAVEVLADAEGLHAHARAVSIRLNRLSQ